MGNPRDLRAISTEAWVRFSICGAVVALLVLGGVRFGHAQLPARSGLSVTSRHGVAATVHPLATAAAVKAMQEGGNAVDAAVVAALVLGVVDGHNSGIGGGCFMLIRLADHSIVAIDGREQAPAAATRDMFVMKGEPKPALSQMGPLAVGIPGSLAAYDHVVRVYGKQSLARHLHEAARVASEGFPVGETLARQLAATAADFQAFPASRSALLKEGRRPYGPGEILQQPDLAKSYGAVAERGIDWFYRGEYARRTADWMKANGGIVGFEDFASYQLKTRQSILTSYRGCQILGFPPPSSGGVHVAQILNILESFNLRALGLGSADLLHVVTEAMKLAFADRAHWLGDPAFAPVPKGLVARSYGERLARKLDMKRATAVPGHHVPDEAAERVFEKHTTHFSTADDQGNWVACTATINTTFGSKVMIPGTGVILNNQMDDFSIQPGTRNFFGLVGAEANAIEPGKRPLSSMSPTLVLREGAPHPVHRRRRRADHHQPGGARNCLHDRLWTAPARGPGPVAVSSSMAAGRTEHRARGQPTRAPRTGTARASTEDRRFHRRHAGRRVWDPEAAARRSGGPPDGRDGGWVLNELRNDRPMELVE